MTADSIKQHKFFKHIDWTKLANKECCAPFKPIIKHETDVNNFTKKFTDMTVTDKPCTPPPNHNRLFRGKMRQFNACCTNDNNQIYQS